MDNFLSKIIMSMFLLFVLVSCSSASFFSSGNQQRPSSSMQGTMWSSNQTTAEWGKLQQMSSATLSSLANKTDNSEQKAWYELALISKRDSRDTQQLVQSLQNWRAQYPNHPANVLFPNNTLLNQVASAGSPSKVALLLPQSGTYAASGQVVREGYLNAYYSAAKGTGQNVKFYDSGTGNVNALYQQALAEGADFVVGPLTKLEVAEIQNINNHPIKTLALNYTDGYRSLPTNFYEFGLLPEDEVSQIVNKAHQTGVSRAIVIAPENAWGKRLANAFTREWQADGGKIVESWYFSPTTNFNQEIANLLGVNPKEDKTLMSENNNKEALMQQRRQDFDVIFLFSQAKEGRVIVPLLRYYYANNVPIYSTSAIYAGISNPKNDLDLNGVTVCDIPWSVVRSGNGAQADRLYAVGQDAFLLSQNVNRLVILPNFPIYGATGSLVLTPTNQIHRRVPCMTIQNGML